MKKKKSKDKPKNMLSDTFLNDKKDFIDGLRKRYDEISHQMIADMDAISPDMHPDEFMRKMTALPLENLTDLWAHQNGKRFCIGKSILARDKVLKLNKKRMEELEKLTNQIEMAEIDFALAKINHLIKKIDE